MKISFAFKCVNCELSFLYHDRFCFDASEFFLQSKFLLCAFLLSKHVRKIFVSVLKVSFLSLSSCHFNKIL